MGGHMGVVLNKNTSACNPLHLPFPLPQPIAGGAVVIPFGPFTLCQFFHVINVGGGGGGGGGC